MITKKTTYLLVLLALLINSSVLGETNDPTLNSSDYFSRGLKQIEKNNYKKGLQIWKKAVSSLDEPDFRISQHFIRTVTKNDLRSYFKDASHIYYWGLEGEITEPEIEALVKELQFLKPLIGLKKYRKIKKLVKDRNNEGLAKIKQIWINADLTPLNNYNERLIEHWQRIAYSYEHFSDASNKDLDDRAFTYIKYGKPYYTRDGTLTYKASFVHRVIFEGVQPPSFASSMEIGIIKAQRYNLETRVRQLHRYPKFEIWIYKDLTDETQNTIFVFGNQGNSNELEKIRSISDFIPSDAYRNVGQHNYSTLHRKLTVNTNDDNKSDVAQESINSSNGFISQVTITPALILQMMYYDQFAAFDDYFGKAYNEMLDRYINLSNTPNVDMEGLAREFSTMHGAKLLQIQQSAPDEVSSFTKDVYNIPADYYTYRFLNNDNEPYLRVYSVLEIKNAVYHDQIVSGETQIDESATRDYLLLSGYNIDQPADSSTDYSNEEIISSPRKTVSISEIPFSNESEPVTLAFELHNAKQINDSTLHDNTPYSKSLKALGNYEFETPEPLNTSDLSTSDFIIGYSSKNEESDISKNNDDPADFEIAHNKIIPSGTDLNLYYELYNLSMEDNTANFSFEYTINKKSKRNGFLGLGIFKGKSDKKSITVNNTLDQDRYEGRLIIETSDRSEGKYVLDIKITDQTTGEELKKSINFEIK